jgi:hypothetical protein
MTEAIFIFFAAIRSIKNLNCAMRGMPKWLTF